jgi:hypothetical protein
MSYEKFTLKWIAIHIVVKQTRELKWLIRLEWPMMDDFYWYYCSIRKIILKDMNILYRNKYYNAIEEDTTVC